MKDFYATESAFLGVCFTYNLPSLYQHASAKDRAKKLFAAMDRTSGITAAKRLTRADANAR